MNFKEKYQLHTDYEENWTSPWMCNRCGNIREDKPLNCKFQEVSRNLKSLIIWKELNFMVRAYPVFGKQILYATCARCGFFSYTYRRRLT